MKGRTRTLITLSLLALTCHVFAESSPTSSNASVQATSDIVEGPTRSRELRRHRGRDQYYDYSSGKGKHRGGSGHRTGKGGKGGGYSGKGKRGKKGKKGKRDSKRDGKKNFIKDKPHMPTSSPVVNGSTKAPAVDGSTKAPAVDGSTKAPTDAPAPPAPAPSTAPKLTTPTISPVAAPKTGAPVRPPTNSPVMAPTGPANPPATTMAPTDNLIRVRVTDYFIAYVTPQLMAAPNQQELDQLVEVTRQFFFELFEAEYAGTDVKFKDIVLTVEKAEFGTGFPEDRFSYYIDFDTVVLYEPDSAQPKGPVETFNVMQSADFVRYILEFVRTIPVFVSTTEVVFRATEMPGS